MHVYVYMDVYLCVCICLYMYTLYLHFWYCENMIPDEGNVANLSVVYITLAKVSKKRIQDQLQQ